MDIVSELLSIVHSCPQIVSFNEFKNAWNSMGLPLLFFVADANHGKLLPAHQFDLTRGQRLTIRYVNMCYRSVLQSMQGSKEARVHVGCIYALYLLYEQSDEEQRTKVPLPDEAWVIITEILSHSEREEYADVCAILKYMWTNNVFMVMFGYPSDETEEEPIAKDLRRTRLDESSITNERVLLELNEVVDVTSIETDCTLYRNITNDSEADAYVEKMRFYMQKHYDMKDTLVQTMMKVKTNDDLLYAMDDNEINFQTSHESPQDVHGAATLDLSNLSETACEWRKCMLEYIDLCKKPQLTEEDQQAPPPLSPPPAEPTPPSKKRKRGRPSKKRRGGKRK